MKADGRWRRKYSQDSGIPCQGNAEEIVQKGVVAGVKWRNEYLSEEELKMLISEVEQNDMVAAPPDITESILTIVVEDKRKEF